MSDHNQSDSEESSYSDYSSPTLTATTLASPRSSTAEQKNIEELRPTARTNRPQSTVMENFTADLDNLFGLHPGVELLTREVEAKKFTVSTSERELQELEARLRKTEERLARVSRQGSPSRAPPAPPTGTAPGAQEKAQPHPFAQRPLYPASRPPTAGAEMARQQAPSNPPPPPPPAPYTANNEYVMVDRTASGRAYA